MTSVPAPSGESSRPGSEIPADPCLLASESFGLKLRTTGLCSVGLCPTVGPLKEGQILQNPVLEAGLHPTRPLRLPHTPLYPETPRIRAGPRPPRWKSSPHPLTALWFVQTVGHPLGLLTSPRVFLEPRPWPLAKLRKSRVLPHQRPRTTWSLWTWLTRTTHLPPPGCPWQEEERETDRWI